MVGHVALRQYLKAPESVRAAFDRQLVAAIEFEVDTTRRARAQRTASDGVYRGRDMGPTMVPERNRWNARWMRRSWQRQFHPEANAYDREALMALDLREYWERITGDAVPPFAKVSCPSPDHDDRNPSCVVGEERWRCFACDAGGTIIDLAALVWEIEPTGRGYFDIRRRLEQV